MSDLKKIDYEIHYNYTNIISIVVLIASYRVMDYEVQSQSADITCGCGKQISISRYNDHIVRCVNYDRALRNIQPCYGGSISMLESKVNNGFVSVVATIKHMQEQIESLKLQNQLLSYCLHKHNIIKPFEILNDVPITNFELNGSVKLFVDDASIELEVGTYNFILVAAGGDSKLFGYGTPGEIKSYVVRILNKTKIELVIGKCQYYSKINLAKSKSTKMILWYDDVLEADAGQCLYGQDMWIGTSNAITQRNQIIEQLKQVYTFINHGKSFGCAKKGNKYIKIYNAGISITGYDVSSTNLDWKSKVDKLPTGFGAGTYCEHERGNMIPCQGCVIICPIKELGQYNENECCICFKNIKIKYMMIPCGHTDTCNTCYEGLDNKCPICREDVTDIMQVP